MPCRHSIDRRQYQAPAATRRAEAAVPRMWDGNGGVRLLAEDPVALPSACLSPVVPPSAVLLEVLLESVRAGKADDQRKWLRAGSGCPRHRADHDREHVAAQRHGAGRAESGRPAWLLRLDRKSTR